MRPSNARIIARDFFSIPEPLYSDGGHLRAAMEWLTRAQDATRCGGVSMGYSLEKGWLAPYPETSGYIIPTFLTYASYSRQSDFIERARSIGDWEINIQLHSGAVRGGVGINDFPSVFNTGQVILGWAALYKAIQEPRFLDAAVKAADWLVSVQDEDGKWSRHVYMDTSSVYHTEVDWPLLELYAITHNDSFRKAAERNIAWALRYARPNGWFEKMAFIENGLPLTHTIGYTLQGLLESSPHLGDEMRKRAIAAARSAAEHILITYEATKDDPYAMPRYLTALLDEQWRPRARYSCLTGDAQIALVWLGIYRLTRDARFLNAALKMLDHVKKTQIVRRARNGIRGGIAGAHPVWGEYQDFVYPNWAAKFFADAIMTQESIMKELER